MQPNYQSTNGLTTKRTQLNKLLVQRNLALAQSKSESKALLSCEQEIKDIETAQCYLQQIAQELQTTDHRSVASVVSKCLSAVFLEPYELRIQFERKRGRTEASFYYYRDGNLVEPHQTSGAVREVTSLALRLVALSLSQPPKRRLLVLDEAFASLDRFNLERVAALLETLASEMDVQIILSTHSDALRIGKIIEIS